MICRKLASALLLAVAGAGTVATEAAPVFYLSTQSEAATPGLLNLSDVAPGSTGTLHIWADSDVRLQGISLELVETGGAVKFTGATTHNPAPRWAFIATPVVNDSSVTRIDGAVLNYYGSGIGTGSAEGPKVLLASVDYTVVQTGHSSLFLKVGEQAIADWDGTFATVHFGTAASPGIAGNAFGQGSAVGSITVIPEPQAAALLAIAMLTLAVWRGHSLTHFRKNRA